MGRLRLLSVGSIDAPTDELASAFAQSTLTDPSSPTVAAGTRVGESTEVELEGRPAREEGAGCWESWAGWVRRILRRYPVQHQLAKRT